MDWCGGFAVLERTVSRSQTEMHSVLQLVHLNLFNQYSSCLSCCCVHFGEVWDPTESWQVLMVLINMNYIKFTCLDQASAVIWSLSRLYGIQRRADNTCTRPRKSCNYTILSWMFYRLSHCCSYKNIWTPASPWKQFSVCIWQWDVTL